MSVYVHFPWCLAKCPYCDFVSYATPREAIDHDGYANAVIDEFEARVQALPGPSPRIGSIFFGGVPRVCGAPPRWDVCCGRLRLGSIRSRTSR
jgi:oxygen-independent coproporphyrinogen-3 oxidase